MLHRLLGVALLMALLGGCLGGPSTPSPTKGATSLLYAPDCTISNWADPCTVKASGNPAPSKAEVDIVASPLDPLNAVAASKDLDRTASGCVWSIAQVTKDGGKTWTTSYVGGKKADRKPGDPLYGFSCVTDPILAYDKGGWLFYTLQAYNAGTDTNAPPNACATAGVPGGYSSGGNQYMARSKDGGITWDSIIPLHAGDDNVVFHDFSRMASNPVTGSTFDIWNQITSLSAPCGPATPGGLPSGAGNVLPVLGGTKDRGQTPIQPVYLVPPGMEAGGFIPATTPYTAPTFGVGGFAIGNDGAQGTMYVFLDAAVNATLDDIYLIKSTNDGAAWSAPRVVLEIHPIEALPGQPRAHTPNTHFRASTTAELAVDNTDGPNHGCLYTAWIDNETGNWDVLSAHSCDGGTVWSKPVRVNHDKGDSYQMMNRIAVGTDGVVHIAYLTQAYDAGKKLVDLEYAYSADGGTNWTTERISQVSSNGDLGIHQDGGPFFGDYIGISAAGPYVYIGAPSTVTGKAEVSVTKLAHTTTPMLQTK